MESHSDQESVKQIKILCFVTFFTIYCSKWDAAYWGKLIQKNFKKKPYVLNTY